MGAYTIEEIFKQYKNKVYRLALSISRNTTDAQDILQNTFIKIMKNIRYFQGRSQLSTWIYKVAYNEALMLLRKRKRVVKLSNYIEHLSKKMPSGLQVNWPKLPDEHLLEGELKERIAAAIKYMPIKYRIAFALHHVEGLPVKQAAQVLGLKENSFKTRLHRGYLLLRQAITSYMQDQAKKEARDAGTCRRFTRFIYDYARGSINPNRKRGFDRHIKDCDSCTSFMDSYIKALTITNALECKDLSPQLQEKIASFLAIS